MDNSKLKIDDEKSKVEEKTKFKLIDVEVLKPIKKYKFKNGLEILGYSKSCDATGFIVSRNGLKVQLDAGILVSNAVCKYTFVTHSHTDHIHELPYLKGTDKHPNKWFIPKKVVPIVDAWVDASQLITLGDRVDPKDFKPENYSKRYDIIGCSGGDVHKLGKKYHVEVFNCDHSIECVGYGFYEMQQKLKKEYVGLKGKEIAKMRKEGVEISEKKKSYEYCFLGDTTTKVFEEHEDILENYPVCIIECTFLLDEHVERAKNVKHVHWNNLKHYVKKHPEITFVLIHFSHRYKNDFIQNFFTKTGYENIIPWV